MRRDKATSIFAAAGVSLAALGTVMLCGASPDGATVSSGPAPDRSAERCAALMGFTSAGIDRADFRAAAPAPPMGPTAPPLPPGQMLPAHCEIHGTLGSRIGADGQQYAIRYHLRLPVEWNGGFFFEGGGGTDGVVGAALGMIGTDQVPALARGYAVVSEDSGHDNAIDDDPARGGIAAFGGDPVARADYGGGSLKPVADAAKAAIERFYGRRAGHSYFVGCSKGGQEGMAFAQRYPDEFDGIVAAAPGFALPRAALAQTADVQTFSALAAATPGAPLSSAALTGAFAPAQLALVRSAVLDACDALDGLRDGIVADFPRCTTQRVLPALRRAECLPNGSGACLSPHQVDALIRSLAGPHAGDGTPLYATWPWDGGIGSEGWRLWKLGNEHMPALNILTGAPALAMIFTVPPTPIADDPQAMLAWQRRFDIGRDWRRIYATSPTFPRSAWTDISARSPDLSAFRAHGGKLIVPQGGSDPVFSINDTLAWYGAVQARTGGQAADFVRVFPVPGMNHCSGGPATDRFDAFAALVDWVENHHAPNRIAARAGPASPWPGRTRPLCAYPALARYTGHGSIEDARNFVCLSKDRT